MRREASEGWKAGDDGTERRSDGRPFGGYTEPEFAAEVRRLIRRIASLDLGRLNPIEVVARWLEHDRDREGRPRTEQWRDSKRVNRLIARLRANLGLVSPDFRRTTTRKHYNVHNTKPESTNDGRSIIGERGGSWPGG